MTSPIMFIAIFVAFAFFYLFLRARPDTKKSLNKTIDEYVKNERLAMTITKVELDEGLFFTVDKELLPFRDYTQDYESETVRVLQRQMEVQKKLELPMIYLKNKISNTELKNTYGVAKFETIIQYEENYEEFMHSLLEWAAALIASENLFDAERVLLTAIEYHCDRSMAYIMLADIYGAYNVNKLKEFYEFSKTAEQLVKSNIVQHKVLSYIEDKINFMSNETLNDSND